MDYELGVLLFHCTEHGHADFNIQGCVEGLLNGITLTRKLDTREVKHGFVSEAQNYWDEEDEDAPCFYELFKETWNSFVSEEDQIK